jgi:4-amino-4-deoxy-L-arabinose transferase-like glycosyltransferase
MITMTPLLSKIPSEKRSPFFGGILLIFLLACGLRWYHLTADSLWMDELFSVWLAKQSFTQFWQVMSHENHPPLYYLMLSGWIKLFGSSAFAIRSLSAVCGVAMVPVLFVACKRLYDIQTAYYVAALAAVLPPFVRYSQEARMYAPVALFATIALIGALLYLQTPTKKYGLLFALGMTLALYTHYFSVFLWAMLVILISGEIWLRKGLKAVGPWSLFCALPLLAYLPWLSVFARQYKENAATHWVAQMTAPGVEQFWIFPGLCFGFFDQRWGAQLGYFGLSKTIIVLLFLVAGAIMFPLIYNTKVKDGDETTDQSKSESTILPGMVSVGMILIIWLLCQMKNAWMFKYMIVVIPGLTIAIGACLCWGNYKQGKSFIIGKKLVSWLFLGNALCATAQTVGTMLPSNQEDWRGAMQWMRRQNDPKAVILVGDPILRVCLTYYGVPESQIAALAPSLCGGMTPEQVRQKLARANSIIVLTDYGYRGQIDKYLPQGAIQKIEKGSNFGAITLENFQIENKEK